MKDATTSRNAWRGMSVAEGGVLLALIVVLGVQHVRHGWPFSLHHGLGLPAAHQEAMSPGMVMPEGGAHAGHAVAGRASVVLPPDRQAFIGLTTVPVETGTVAQPFRAIATIAPDESRLSHVHTRVSGWVERLYVNTTGQAVRAGAPLLAIFSQDLLAGQTEYLSALQASSQATGALASAQATVQDASRRRLLVLGMSESEVASVSRTRRPIHSVVISSPRAGVVLRRGVTVGTSVDPSTELLLIADLSTVWGFLEIPEVQIPNVQVGTQVVLDFPGAGVTGLRAAIDFLYPVLTEETRTLRARVAMLNPTGVLRPGVYGSAEVLMPARTGLIVPRDAIVDTGDEKHVFVRMADGQFAPRRVVTGARFADRVEVTEGLDAGEQIAASGVFLLDSESRLRASTVSGGGGAGGHAGHGH